MAKKETNTLNGIGLTSLLKNMVSLILALGAFIGIFEFGYSQGEKNVESKMYEELGKANKEYQVKILELNSQIIDLKTKNGILELYQAKLQKQSKNEN
jgi:hypothetical protein